MLTVICSTVFYEIFQLFTCIGYYDSSDLLTNTLETISATLAKGDRVQLSGFGIFEVKERGARVGRNPHTKETIEIPASRTPAFKASKALKDIVG